MSRRVTSLLVFCVAAALSACGGYYESEAIERCEVEQAARAVCFDDAVYASCVACFDECGDDCVAANDCPETYTCAE